MLVITSCQQALVKQEVGKMLQWDPGAKP